MSIDIRKLLGKSTLGAVLIHFATAMVVILLLGVLYFYAYLPNATNHGETITVPNIEGKSITEIEAFLAKHDLRFEVNDSSYSDKFPPLTVLKQYPSAGAKVKENRKIYVSVNRVNPPTVPMPNLVDASLVGADAILKANELKRGRIQLVSWPFPTVKEMRFHGRKLSPNERIAKGSAIDLLVGDGGSDKAKAPPLLGNSLEDAKVLIFGYNLSLGEIHLVGDTLNENPVILKQMPESGENIRVGDVVEIWIGKAGSVIPDEETEEIDQ